MKTSQEEVGPTETVAVAIAEPKVEKEVEIVPEVVITEKQEKKHKKEKKVKEEKVPEPV